MKNPVEKLGEEKVTEILQVKELQMLKEVRNILQTNGIPFWLACGTMLGCVRHQGFIPWDDDIDIYIRGKDYPRVRELFAGLKETNLEFQDYSAVKDYPYTFPKFAARDTVLVEEALTDVDYHCGVYIDIFPLYGITDNAFLRTLQEKKRYFRYALLRARYHGSFSGGKRKILGFLARKLISPVRVQQKLEKTYTRDREGTKYLIDPGVFGQNALVRSESFSETTEMRFEDSKMPVPKGFDAYLCDYYGDYMQLPPKEKQVSQHHIAQLEIQGVPELAE